MHNLILERAAARGPEGQLYPVNTKTENALMICEWVVTSSMQSNHKLTPTMRYCTQNGELTVTCKTFEEIHSFSAQK